MPSIKAIKEPSRKQADHKKIWTDTQALMNAGCSEHEANEHKSKKFKHKKDRHLASLRARHEATGLSPEEAEVKAELEYIRSARYLVPRRISTSLGI